MNVLSPHGAATSATRGRYQRLASYLQINRCAQTIKGMK